MRRGTVLAGSPAAGARPSALRPLTHGEPAGVRGASATLRSLSFAAGDSTVELDVAADGLTGLVVPLLPGRVRVESPDGAGPVAVVDEFGGFPSDPARRAGSGCAAPRPSRCC